MPFNLLSDSPVNPLLASDGRPSSDLHTGCLRAETLNMCREYREIYSGLDTKADELEIMGLIQDFEAGKSLAGNDEEDGERTHKQGVWRLHLSLCHWLRLGALATQLANLLERRESISLDFGEYNSRLWERVRGGTTERLRGALLASWQNQICSHMPQSAPSGAIGVSNSAI